MYTNEDILKSGETLMKAYVALKAGETRRAAKLFASIDGAGIDPIMDGVAKAMLRLKAEGEECDTEEDMEDEEEMDEDEEEDMEDEEGDEEEVEETCEVPASVAKYLEID